MCYIGCANRKLWCWGSGVATEYPDRRRVTKIREELGVLIKYHRYVCYISCAKRKLLCWGSGADTEYEDRRQVTKIRVQELGVLRKYHR